ncbi:MAG: bifunctional folylpolyglutamate synthase/dihydrofolate synthase [Chitinophagaceae bacterium]|nr:bifunctional folylpolyglutamate synthase/dihydrofolate synthase [Chitinophagaceae bacterium]
MNYRETLTYLMERLPMFSRIGAAAYKPSLDNTLALCAALGNPQQHIKTIHIAGTNGKGSVSHMLAAILQEAGYKTGLYTSPHLREFRERIRINGIPCDETFVVDFTAKCQDLIASTQPSFFEITVAMAFDWFYQNKVDVAVIETGLGGRLDSTNIIHPQLSVITSIGLDHMNLLGNTVEAIAGEKAGIIKQNTPVVIGSVDASLHGIFSNKVIQESGTSSNQLLHFSGQEWKIKRVELNDTFTVFVEEQNDTGTEYSFQLDLPGYYQQWNVVTVLSAVRVLQQLGYSIGMDQVESALKKVVKVTGLHGRWETIRQQPHVVLEVAHNEDGIRQVINHLQRLQFGRLFIIIGVVRDKEINSVLSLLPKDAHYFFSQASLPRALPANELMQLAVSEGLTGEIIPDVNDALKKAISIAVQEDLILVCGSIFLVGEVDVQQFSTTSK